MKPTEQTKRYVIATYVQPARQKGEKTIQVRVGNIQKELGWTNRTPSVFSTLLSPASCWKSLDNRVGNIQKELGWTNRTPSVFSTLLSRDFQQEAGVELVEKRGGPPSGGPSTTWQLVF